MIPGIEAIYERIARSIQNAIPEEWSFAQMEAIFFNDSIKFSGEYARKQDGVARSFATERDGQRAFRDLRRAFKEAGKQPFGGAVFELHSDGRFNLKLHYENCDEHGNTLFDEDAELKRATERHERLTRD